MLRKASLASNKATLREVTFVFVFAQCFQILLGQNTVMPKSINKAHRILKSPLFIGRIPAKCNLWLAPDTAAMFLAGIFRDDPFSLGEKPVLYALPDAERIKTQFGWLGGLTIRRSGKHHGQEYHVIKALGSHVL